MLKKGQLPILIVSIVAIILFTVIFISRQNYEFLVYVGVIVFFLFLILATNHKVDYPIPVLWALTLWAVLHMSGGGIFLSGTRLYEIVLVPLVGQPYNLLKYDQLVHVVGFAAATLVMYYLLKPSLKDQRKWISLSIVIVMAGLGVGALNEIIEFAATVAVPETGVGGYENTALDLVADLVGAIAALLYIRYQET